MDSVNQYIEDILSYVELNEKNKRDIKQEFNDHINSKVKEYKDKGYDEKQAVDQSISDFGETEKVGKELNREMFPFRRSLLIILGLSSILFSVMISFFANVFHDITPYIWLVITLLSSLILFYFASKPARASSNRLLLLCLLLWIFLLHFYGLFLMDGLMENQLFYFSLFGLLVINISLILIQIYLGAVFQPISKELQTLSNQKRRIIILTNIITGFVILGVALINLAGYLIFGPGQFPIKPVVLILLWVILLICQIKIRKLENTARFLMIIFGLLVFADFMYIQLAYL